LGPGLASFNHLLSLRLDPFDNDLEQAGCRVLVPNSIPDRSLGQWFYMHPEHHGWRWIGKRPGIQHGLGTAGLLHGRAFLSRLENE
jgi:hypothetical protein